MQTREAIESQLVELRRDRGSAALDGKKFDGAKIVAAEAELAALDDTETERTRREREQADRDRAAERRRLLRQADKLEADRLLAWSDLQIACATMREAIGRVAQNSEVERGIWAAMQEQVPPALNPADVYARLGLRIANELSKAPGCKSRIGGAVQWSGIGGVLGNDDDWRAAEAKLMQIPIKALMDELNIEDAE